MPTLSQLNLCTDNNEGHKNTMKTFNEEYYFFLNEIFECRILGNTATNS